jgi:hypothetical protein
MILLVVSFPPLITPILARTVDNTSLPTRILELTNLNSKLPTNQVLLPDWSRISFSQMPGITRSGSIDGSSYTQVLGYDLSRSWTVGMTPDKYLKLGDISQAFQAEMFSLKAISDITRINLEQSALSAFPLIAHQTLNHLAEVVPKLAPLVTS